MFELVMGPCLRAGYHQAIVDLMEFMPAIEKELAHEPYMKLLEKLSDMMKNKRLLDWGILREEQSVMVDEVIRKRKPTSDETIS